MHPDTLRQSIQILADETSVTAVARAVGMQRTSLHRYLSSSRPTITDATRWRLERLLRDISRQISAENTPENMGLA